MRLLGWFIRPIRRRLRARLLALVVGSPEVEAWLAKLVEDRLRATTARADDAHRLAVAASRSVEHLLQAEVELWQAVDDRSTVDTRSG